MDKPGLHRRAVVMMQQGVQHIIAHEGPRRVGQGAGEACGGHGVHHGPDGHGGEVGRGAVRHDGHVHGLKAAVVRNVSEKHIELYGRIAFAVEEIAVSHGYLVKVGKHCEISLFKIVHFEHRLRINIAIIALHIPFFNPDRNNFII